jgi:hypothetical protein
MPPLGASIRGRCASHGSAQPILDAHLIVLCTFIMTPSLGGIIKQRSSWRIVHIMQVATGTVINGKIVLEGVSLTEGAVVTVVTRGADESFLLTDAQENELLAAMAEIERGDYLSLEELLQSLPAQN